MNMQNMHQNRHEIGRAENLMLTMLTQGGMRTYNEFTNDGSMLQAIVRNREKIGWGVEE
jgi:hypothetical protein